MLDIVEEVYDCYFIYCFPIFIGIDFVFALAMVLSQKLRSKMLGHQIKTLNYTVKDNKDELTDLISNTSGIGINAKKRIMDDYEDTIRDINTREANIKKDSIEITARAIRDGLVGEKMY